MSLRRYLFAYDASYPLFWVQRYLATDHPHNTAEPLDVSTRPDFVSIMPREETEDTGGLWGSDNPAFPVEDRTVPVSEGSTPEGGLWGGDANRPSNPNPEAEARVQEQRNKWRQRWDVEKEAWVTRDAEMQEARRMAATTDIFSPNEWAVVDADVFVTDDNSEHLPQQMQTFLAAPHTRVDNFFHFCDVPLARAFLREAMKRSLNDIQNISNVHDQAQAVRDMWQNFANYWGALNVRPWGWAAYRCAWEYFVGSYWGNFTNTLGENYTLQLCIGNGFHFVDGAVVSPPSGMTEVFWRRPTSEYRQVNGYSWVSHRTYLPTGDISYWFYQRMTSGFWRGMARQAMIHLFGTTLASSGEFGYFDLNKAHQLRFGQWEAIGRAQARIMPTSSDKNCGNEERRERLCPYPTGEAHRLWITDFATLTGDLYYPEQVSANGAFDLVGSQPWPDFVDPSKVYGNTRTGDWTTYAGSITKTPPYAFLPPLNWYAQMLWPLMEYLASRDPLEVVYEVRLDVLGKNLWTSCATGFGDGVLSSIGQRQAIVGAQEMRAGASTGAGWTVMRGATSVLALIPVIGSLASGVLGLISAGIQLAIGASEYSDDRYFDCFGRLEPALETHQITLISDGSKHEAARMALFPSGQPANPPGYVEEPMAVLYDQASQTARAREAALLATLPPMALATVSPGMPLATPVEFAPGRDPKKLAIALALALGAAGGLYYVVSRSKGREP